MTAHQDLIKQHAAARLDRKATVHPSGHQNVHARRYLVPAAAGRKVEVVIIVKGANLQLWCEADAIDHPAALRLGGRHRPGSETYSEPNRDGTRMLYGRHSSLQKTERLHRGDAWHFVPATIGDLDRILDAIEEGGKAAP